jgi:hypothetical protein
VESLSHMTKEKASIDTPEDHYCRGRADCSVYTLQNALTRLTFA